MIAALGEGLVELGLNPERPDEALIGFGGVGPYAAVMAARLGVSARIGGRVGADVFGRRLLRFWEDNKIDIRHVLIDPDAPTGIYVNELGRDGLNRFWSKGGLLLSPSFQ